MQTNQQSQRSTVKPTQPGRYYIWNGEIGIYLVTVRRYGRGLRVVPDPPYPPFAMGDVGKDEFVWMSLSSKPKKEFPCH